MGDGKDTRHQDLVQAIGDRTKGYLVDELDIAVDGIQVEMGDVKRCKLRDMTSILAIEADIQMLVAFSFDRDLAERIFIASTEGLEISAAEEEMMRDETLTEMINIIVGNAMQELAVAEGAIPISPPITIGEAKNITRHRNATFYTLDIATADGLMSIHFIGPKNLFDLNLNYVEKG